MSYGIVEGYAFDDNVGYCPYCGEEIAALRGDGSVRCEKCGIRFAVIEVDDGEIH